MTHGYEDHTVTMTVTPAMARVMVQALDGWEAVINGDVDGKRRVPWDNFAMDADEGEEVPGALTHEAGYRLLLEAARTECGKAAWQG